MAITVGQIRDAFEELDEAAEVRLSINLDTEVHPLTTVVLTDAVAIDGHPFIDLRVLRLDYQEPEVEPS